MAINLVAIPGGAASTRKTLDELSDDVKSAVEDAYKYNEEFPARRLEAAFPTQQEGDDFLKDARAYAYQRPAGRVIVVGNTTKKGLARFRVVPFTGDDETEETAGE